ncbi:hypothetical protein ZOSMA_42G00410 [Zostera marina]|uniref:Uncharacterized protein n=1 Tax=Zostera marina TaxID=29655 RepID=A0A0K9P484_ZOSMR|nr:hypothetical protein ZOSMA_42G00410 [Zostera marina]
MSWVLGFRSNTATILILLLSLLIINSNSDTTVSVQGRLVLMEIEAETAAKETSAARKVLVDKDSVVHTNDYGNYYEAPTLEKPSFKLIPN